MNREEWLIATINHRHKVIEGLLNEVDSLTAETASYQAELDEIRIEQFWASQPVRVHMDDQLIVTEEYRQYRKQSDLIVAEVGDLVTVDEVVMVEGHGVMIIIAPFGWVEYVPGDMAVRMRLARLAVTE